MATVAMAWVLRNPVVDAPIIGATKDRHLTDAAAALELALTDDEVAALENPMSPASQPISRRRREQPCSRSVHSFGYWTNARQLGTHRQALDER